MTAARTACTDPAGRRQLGGRRAHRLHDAGELGDDAVARRAEYPPAVLSDEIADRAATGRQRRERSFLVGGHQTALAGDIGGEDDGALAFQGPDRACGGQVPGLKNTPPRRG